MMNQTRKVWRLTDSPGMPDDQTYDESVGPRGPLANRAPLLSELETRLGLGSFDDQVTVLRATSQRRVCSCSDAELARCKKSC